MKTAPAAVGLAAKRLPPSEAPKAVTGDARSSRPCLTARRFIGTADFIVGLVAITAAASTRALMGR